MIIFMAVFVLLMNILQVSGLEDDDVLYFEDIQSDQPGKDWDKLPLISQTRTRTDWCEVTPGSVIMVSPSIAQEVEEVEEIREMDGRRYINRFLLQQDNVTEIYVYDKISGALEPRQLR